MDKKKKKKVEKTEEVQVMGPEELAHLSVKDVLGIFSSILILHPERSWILYLVIIGFCGGLSTFSTFSSEIFHFIRQEKYTLLLSYVALSVCLCVIAVTAGYFLSRKFVS